MTSTTTNAAAVHPEAEGANSLFDNWFDPIKAGLRKRVRGFIEATLEAELAAVLARPRYGRRLRKFKTDWDAWNARSLPTSRSCTARRPRPGGGLRRPKEFQMPAPRRNGA